MFSELLNTFRLQAEVYNNAQFCGHWVIQEHSEDQTCFHMVTIGRCQMSIPGEPDQVLELGDLVVFPKEIPHTLRPFEDSKEVDLPLDIFLPSENKHGTALLCGALQFEHSGFHHILDTLPKVFIIRRGEASWIGTLLSQIKAEILRPLGADECILNRLSELLFIYALRHQMQRQEHKGFLNLFSHRALQPALNAMKNSPEIQWSLEELGNTCAMSRTKFSQLFKQVSGLTAIEFLTWWRMQLAYDYLRQGQRITQVAVKIGYQSESAFSRAFKKCFGINPSEV